jgi:cerevisin
MKGIAALLGFVGIATASPVFGHASMPEVPLIQSANAKHIPNSYIVKFKDHVKHSDAAAHHSWVSQLHLKTESSKMELRKRSQIPFVDDAFTGLKHTYNIAGSFLGYSGHFDDEVLAEMRRHPDVSCQLPSAYLAGSPPFVCHEGNILAPTHHPYHPSCK